VRYRTTELGKSEVEGGVGGDTFPWDAGGKRHPVTKSSSPRNKFQIVSERLHEKIQKNGEAFIGGDAKVGKGIVLCPLTNQKRPPDFLLVHATWESDCPLENS